MAIRVNKKVFAIGIIFLFAVLIGVGGYIAWRVSTAEQISEEEAGAANNCCDDPTWAPDGCKTEEEWKAGYNACKRKECELCAQGGGCSEKGQSCSADRDCCGDLVCDGGKCKEGESGGDDFACQSDSSICSGKGPTDCAIHGESGCVWCDNTNSCECNECPQDGGGGGGGGCITCTCNGWWDESAEKLRLSCTAQNSCNETMTINYGVSICSNDLVCDGVCGGGTCEVDPNNQITIPAGGSAGVANTTTGCESEAQLDVCFESGVIACSIIRCGEPCEGTPEPPPEVLPEYLRVRGRAYCQVPSGELYPVQGAQVLFFKLSNQAANETLTSGEYGYFTSADATTMLTHGPFAVRYQGLADSTRTLSNGTEYSDMTGPTLNQDVFTRGTCSTPTTTGYEECANMLTSTVNGGFNFIFGNCEIPLEGWEIDKEGTMVCYEEGTASAYAEVDYTITVTNTGEATAYVDAVVDEYDSNLWEDWIISTNPANATIADGKITWTLSGTDREFEPNVPRVFSYRVRIPRDMFGQNLENHAIAELGTGEELHAYEDIFITCEGYTAPGELPGTGIFDNTLARIGLGFVLVAVGYAYYKFGLFDSSMMWLTKQFGKVEHTLSRDGKKERWEKRMVNKVDEGKGKASRE